MLLRVRTPPSGLHFSTRKGQTGAPPILGVCDIVVYNMKYVFGLRPHLWH